MYIFKYLPYYLVNNNMIYLLTTRVDVYLICGGGSSIVFTHTHTHKFIYLYI